MTNTVRAVAAAALLGVGAAAIAGCAAQRRPAPVLTRFVIEREVPGAGTLSGDELRAIAQKSNEVLRQLGPGIVWVQSFVTQDKIYCVYDATSPQLIRDHAARGGFPADRVEEVAVVIGPETGR